MKGRRHEALAAHQHSSFEYAGRCHRWPFASDRNAQAAEPGVAVREREQVCTESYACEFRTASTGLLIHPDALVLSPKITGGVMTFDTLGNIGLVILVALFAWALIDEVRG